MTDLRPEETESPKAKARDGRPGMTPNEPIWDGELLAAPHAVADKAGRVRRMFNAIAPRYTLVNSLFSAGRDAAWRRRAVTWARVSDSDDVLDVACGPGEFARAFLRANPRRVVGCDFAHEMLLRAVDPTSNGHAGSATGNLAFLEADAQQLPFADAAFSIVSCAFGVRNFQDLDRGLAEMYRVLRRGGRAVVLEFSRPRNPMVRGVYEFYAGRLMPFGATWISGDRSGAYRYLPQSVVSYLTVDQMCERFERAGFARCSATPLSFGVVTIYVAHKD